MRKTGWMIVALLWATMSWAGNYGILVNGTTYFAGEPAGEFEGRMCR